MYNVLIKGVGDKQLGDLIAKIGTRKHTIKLTHYLHPNQEKKTGKVGRVNSTDNVMLGNIDGLRDGSLTHRMVKIIQDNEKRKGAGSLTRAQLTKKLENYSDAPGAVITAALARGIIKGVNS